MPSRPVVGIVTTWFERGGSYVARALRESLANDFDVFIYARGGESFARGNARWDTPDVHWMGETSIRGSSWIDEHDFRGWLRQHHIDLVIFNEQEWWLPPALWARAEGSIVTSYIDYYTPVHMRWMSVFDYLWCFTRKHAQAMRDHPGARHARWGTDLEMFRPATESPLADELRFFHSAGMNPWRKGTDLVLRAFQLVGDPARLTIHTQEPLTEDLLALADDRVEIHTGTVPAPGLYHRGDVYVYPTRLEGIGLSVPEAIASGLPVIATDVAPTTEFVVPSVSGWRVPVASTYFRRDDYFWPAAECDVPSLARVMQSCVDRRAERQDWKARATAFARDELDWRRNGREFASLVAQATKNGALANGPSTRVAWEVRTQFADQRNLGTRAYGRVLRSFERLRRRRDRLAEVNLP